MKRLRHPNRSLQARLTLFNVVAVAVALTITAGGVLVDQYHTVRDDILGELDSIGSLIASNAQAPLLFEDHEAALDLLGTLSDLDADIDACILDRDGGIFAAHPANLDWTGRLDLRDRGEDPPGRRSRTVDIVVSGDVIGTAYLTAGMDRFYAYMGNVVATLALIVGLALAVSLYVGHRTMRSVLRPLENLERGTREIIDDGNYALRVASVSDDELGRLTDSFNDMLAQIEARDLALTRSHDDLERRVAERTSELEQEVRVRQTAEESMRHAMVEAENANRAKSEFLANMSHELRTPLHGILSFAQFGLREADAGDLETLRGHYEAIAGSGETLLHLLDDLLDLAKLEAGRMSFEFQPCLVDDLLAAGVAEFDSLTTTSNVRVRLDSRIGDLEMDVDPVRFMQILRNLLSNAVKFSPADGVVTVASSVRDGNLVVEVSDRGVGVPAEEREAIFDKFIQSSKTKTGAGGTGLGLAITREIVETHRGRVWVADNPGGGAVFTVELPIVSAGALEPELEPCAAD